jgi:hypothetical protein
MLKIASFGVLFTYVQSHTLSLCLLCIGNMHIHIASVLYLASGNFLLQPITPKEIELHVAEVPSAINLDRPFLVILVLFLLFFLVIFCQLEFIPFVMYY